jgi:hypothetical protein
MPAPMYALNMSFVQYGTSNMGEKSDSVKNYFLSFFMDLRYTWMIVEFKSLGKYLIA